MPNNIDNIYAWLYVLACFPQGIVTGWAFTRCFKFRISNYIAIMLIAVVLFLLVIPQTIFQIHVPYKPFIIYSLFLLTLILLKDTQESKPKVLLFAALNILTDMFCELFIMVICLYGNIFDFEQGVHYYDANRVIATMSFTFISIPLKYMATRIWNKLNKKSQARLHSAVVLFPIAQFLCVVAVVIEYSRSIIYFPEAQLLFGINTSAIITFSFFIFIIADLLYLFFISDLERKYQLESDIKSMEHAHQLEAAHYMNLLDKRYEVAKIRHDIKNQLLCVRNMITNGNIDEANGLINDLSREIEQTNESIYSSIPVVEAVLTEKATLIAQHEIRLETNILIPEDIHIAQNHLCSVFSNLLDNAIHANLLIEDVQQRFISISAFIEADALLISAENTVAKNTKQGELKPRDQGYGLKILNDIALTYKGYFKAEVKENICTSTIFLKNEQIN